MHGKSPNRWICRAHAGADCTNLNTDSGFGCVVSNVERGSFVGFTRCEDADNGLFTNREPSDIFFVTRASGCQIGQRDTALRASARMGVHVRPNHRSPA